MAILGVLLGIMIPVLAFGLWYGYKYIPALRTEIASLVERVVFLEKRKALLAEVVTGQPKPVGVAGTKLRTWNEDAAGRE